MSSFGDELRNLIAKKAEQLNVTEMLRQRQEREEERKEAELRAAAWMLAADVFQSLVKEFGNVLEAAGVFAAGSSVVNSRINRPGGYVALHARGGAGVFHVMLFAAATAEGRIELRAKCILATTSAEPKPKVKSQTEEPIAAWEEVLAVDDPEDRAPRPLVEIAPKSIAPDPASLAAEQWARAALKKCAEACVAAERKRS